MDEPRAKYVLVENYVKELINTEQKKVGDQLETEQQIAKKFNISRLTVNKALSRLAFDGLVEQIPGKGTFIKSTALTADYKTVGSFTKYLDSQRKKSGSNLIEYRIVTGREYQYIANQLKISLDDNMFYFVRVRTANDEPIAMMASFMPCKVCPDFDITVLQGSLYDYFDKVGLPRVSVRSRLTAISADEYYSKNLCVPLHSALLKHYHVTISKDGLPIEYCDATYIGEKYSYDIEQRYIV